MAAVENNDYQNDEQGETQERHTKEVLVRNSDMAPEVECEIISISNSAIEEVADMQGIF